MQLHGRREQAIPSCYRTTNWSSYNAALRKRGSLLIWLDREMTWLAPHEGRLGRSPVFSNAAIQFHLSIKVLFKLPLRQTAGMRSKVEHVFAHQKARMRLVIRTIGLKRARAAITLANMGYNMSRWRWLESRTAPA